MGPLGIGVKGHITAPGFEGEVLDMASSEGVTREDPSPTPSRKARIGLGGYLELRSCFCLAVARATGP